MKLSNISLPYPVLGIVDDLIPTIDENNRKVKIDHDHYNYYVTFDLSFDNGQIQQYIDDGFAEFTCEIDCSSTVFRKSLSFPKNQFKITIPKKSVFGRVIFNCFVSVKKPISNYSNKNFNDDYKGFSFDLEPGDILVGFPPYFIDTDIKYEKLHAAGTFLEIIPGSPEQRETTFNFETEKIQIVLPLDLFRLYDDYSMSKEFAVIMQASLAYNALTCALYEISSYPATIKWIRAIGARLQTEDELKEFLVSADEDTIEVERVPELAMKLLKDPYNRLINYLSIEADRNNQNENDEQ